MKDYILYEGYFDGQPTGIIFYGREYNLFKKELTSLLNQNNIKCEK